jgi:multidrug efflux pump subunit AcrB
MALNISAWSIRNPLPSIVFSIILLVLGWVSFTKLAVTRLPSADIPVISVAVAQFGAAPAELNRRSQRPSRTASPASRACGTSHRRSPTGCR